MLKCSSERWVCAPHSLSAGTSTSPRLSVSLLMAIIGSLLALSVVGAHPSAPSQFVTRWAISSPHGMRLGRDDTGAGHGVNLNGSDYGRHTAAASKSALRTANSYGSCVRARQPRKRYVFAARRLALHSKRQRLVRDSNRAATAGPPKSSAQLSAVTADRSVKLYRRVDLCARARAMSPSRARRVPPSACSCIRRSERYMIPANIPSMKMLRPDRNPIRLPTVLHLPSETSEPKSR